MAKLLKLLTCLLLVACAYLGGPKTVALATDNPEPPTPVTSTTTTMPTTSAPPDCASNPCHNGSSCEDRANDTYVCLCKTGAYYNYTLKNCVPAKVFPGELLFHKLIYTEEMGNTKSDAFLNTSKAIVSQLNDTFENGKTYVISTVIKLSSPPPTRTKTTGVLATVDIIYEEGSAVTLEEVNEALLGANNIGTLKVCPRTPCDEKTTTCKDFLTGFNCTCKKDYVISPYSDLLCVACPSGKKAVGGECEPCSFGYTGFNCTDNWQLILVIVGSVLGVLLLITTILLPVVAAKSKKKSKMAKAENYGKPYSNSAPAKSPQVNNGFRTPVKAAPSGGMSGYGGNGVSRIPRAVNNDNWDRNPNLEMVPSNSQQNLIPRNSRRFHDQGDTNPYDRHINQQTNPYASSQSNPYYRN